jgi:hypothetical protein
VGRGQLCWREFHAGGLKVAEWLKYLEMGSASIKPDDPMATYDFAWMWKELKVEDLRR